MAHVLSRLTWILLYTEVNWHFEFLRIISRICNFIVLSKNQREKNGRMGHDSGRQGAFDLKPAGEASSKTWRIDRSVGC